MHARAGDEEAVRLEILVVERARIPAQRLAQLRQPTLIRIERLARLEALGGGIGDELRRRKIALAGPHGDDPLLAAGMIDDGNDAACRRLHGFAAQAGEGEHGGGLSDKADVAARDPRVPQVG